MKKILIINILCLLSISLFSQEKIKLKTPAASPEAAFTQEIGTTELQVAYARPLARGRKIYGDLVPFGEVWRTGASDCTTLKFPDDLTIGDKKITAGKYALFTIPNLDEWIIIINTDTTLHGTTGYDDKKDVYRFKVKPSKTARFYETFTIELNDINARSEGFLNLIWENTVVQIPIKSLDDETILAAIQTRIVENKEQDADLFYQAASYYFSTKRDLKQAIDWVSSAQKLDAETYSYPNLEQKIWTELKDYRAAIGAAKRALDIAEKKNMASSIVILNKKIKDWQEILGEKPTPIVVETAPIPTPNVPKTDHAAHNMQTMETPNMKQQFEPVLSAYYDLKDALVADNAKLAAAKVAVLKNAFSALETTNWSEKQRATYAKTKKDIQKIADDGANIEKQRTDFESLSNNLFSITKALKINTETVYLQYCPMKNASWMSSEKAIKNPYYGKSMLTCGQVNETLKK